MDGIHIMDVVDIDGGHFCHGGHDIVCSYIKDCSQKIHIVYLLSLIFVQLQEFPMQYDLAKTYNEESRASLQTQKPIASSFPDPLAPESEAENLSTQQVGWKIRLTSPQLRSNCSSSL